MWKKKDFGSSEQDKLRSSFFSSGFYGSSEEDSESPNSNFRPSTPGVLAPSERVGSVRPNKVNDGVVRLAASIQGSQQFDAVRLTLKLADWTILAEHMQPFTVETGQEVIRQGATEVTVYIVESGTLGVHHEDANGKVQLATVGSGSVVGEGAFFARTPRNATVQALSRCVLWGLSPMRYAELAHRHPSIALSFVMALGSVVTRRMTNKPKRGAVT
ncbi:cyclic nucleotide-binding domain-containing protein [Variovorax sp. PCZ-1]|uniref:cyclic nucleotide-binding domain-containing protein n=1 Tax=Variovorax sp. PCZ-1 TaxID=2835533 RepID=UPI0020BECD44|nr:cyclic nucleotide-binding domain-containing protein [Variovorax sp. PCZ-1]